MIHRSCAQESVVYGSFLIYLQLYKTIHIRSLVIKTCVELITAQVVCALPRKKSNGTQISSSCLVEGCCLRHLFKIHLLLFGFTPGDLQRLVAFALGTRPRTCRTNQPPVSFERNILVQTDRLFFSQVHVGVLVYKTRFSADCESMLTEWGNVVQQPCFCDGPSSSHYRSIFWVQSYPVSREQLSGADAGLANVLTRKCYSV